jgi:CHAT domain-containing protein
MIYLANPITILQLPRLLESRKEALSIAKVFPPGRVFEAFDFDANSTIMNGRAIRRSRILHLATHGLFDAQNAQLSGLFFRL